MRIINLIVVHCTATQGNRTLSPEALDLMHRRRGFNGTGYHYYIRKDGTVHLTRPVERIGAHAKGFNASSIGICYEGGLDCRGRPADTPAPGTLPSGRHPDTGTACYASAADSSAAGGIPQLPGVRASGSLAGQER